MSTPLPDEANATGEPDRIISTKPVISFEERLFDDLHWAAQVPEMLQHPGKLVAVRNNRVVAVGLDEAALRKEAAAREGCPEGEFAVVMAPDLGPTTLTPIPGWQPDAQPRRPIESRPMTPLEKRQCEDASWATNAPEVHQYPGEFVVVRNKRVVAHGLDENQLVKQAAAQEQCPEYELVVLVIPPLELWEIPR
jgi:Family of unknown function (DUF5678)